jgi:CubicO group peptidase (beta-lactamase class C family)
LQPEQFVYSPQQWQCILAAFRTRAIAYRSRLRGYALSESKLSPPDSAQLQIGLITLGHRGGVFINAYDMGRFGYLTLRHGKWQERQLLSDKWVELPLTPEGGGAHLWVHELVPQHRPPLSPISATAPT